MNRTAHAGFAPDALEQAIHARKPARSSGASLVHRSDRGARYLSIEYSERLAEAGIDPSVGSVGDGCNNALVETINGLYSAPSATSRPQRPKQITMPPAKTRYGCMTQTRLPPKNPGRFNCKSVAVTQTSRGPDMLPCCRTVLTVRSSRRMSTTDIGSGISHSEFVFMEQRPAALGVALPAGTGYRR